MALQNPESFDEEATGETLVQVAHLIAWAQAQQARLLTRMHTIFLDSYAAASGQVEPGMAFSLASSECAAILHVPQVTAQRMMFEANRLTGSHTATLKALEDGRLSYPHAQVVLEQCEGAPAAGLAEFEADLIAAAEGRTRAQFSCKARRLREAKYPETVPERHRSAFEQRKVTLDRDEDGMSWLSAHLAAAEAQQIYTALSTAARGEQSAGDPRTRDQLRADILAQLLLGGFSGKQGRPTASGAGGSSAGSSSAGSSSAGSSSAGSSSAGSSSAGSSSAGSSSAGSSGAGGGGDLSDSGPDPLGVLPRAEIMVLINAETLFGADEQPAELHGYGPISAEAARRLARNATRWTGLVQDPRTGEILGVGRRRKVPAGLARWLRARDGTCRFPGCRVSTANSDIDHTTDWAKGGPTDHRNLEHLCRRHHRFKTLGFWKACQPTPGVIEWTSPTGRIYRTEPFLELGPPAPDLQADHEEKEPRQEPAPPF
ncbi:HNH endonuclease signature motif containing protein [Arthrobacter sp. zg-Y844]|uniref:HNH endonuclease signature motif containing protein n=1 Tax=Arthrobacter sp. zg-Y844 TaxID=2964612 RepID=UPI002104CD95|nr:HNH endonuclease signature motif containing protein [Arthrobacter sp. zg-Y844]MCQ1988240.1 HNH endonuclease [Arthrobacter sp. zg-Y844]